MQTPPMAAGISRGMMRETPPEPPTLEQISPAATSPSEALMQSVSQVDSLVESLQQRSAERRPTAPQGGVAVGRSALHHAERSLGLVGPLSGALQHAAEDVSGGTNGAVRKRGQRTDSMGARAPRGGAAASMSGHERARARSSRLERLYAELDELEKDPQPPFR